MAFVAVKAFVVYRKYLRGQHPKRQPSPNSWYGPTAPVSLNKVTCRPPFPASRLHHSSFHQSAPGSWRHNWMLHSHVLIESLLIKGFETKLIASEALCTPRAVQRIRLETQRFEMPTRKRARIGRPSRVTPALKRALRDLLTEQPYVDTWITMVESLAMVTNQIELQPQRHLYSTCHHISAAQFLFTSPVTRSHQSSVMLGPYMVLESTRMWSNAPV